MMHLQRPASSHRRFGWLDTARGLAALAVLIQHSLEGAGIEALRQGAVATSWINLGETGVAIFFLVSGFIIPASVQGGATARDFWIRRVLRIYPLYWAVFALTLILTAVIALKPLPSLGRTIVFHAMFIQEWVHWPNFVGGAWTLLIELVWYIIFSIVFFGWIGGGVRLVWLGLVAYASISAVFWTMWPGGPLGRLSLLALCFYGYAYLLRTENTLSAARFRLIAVCFIVCIGLNFFIRFYLNPTHFYFEPSFKCVVVSWSLALTIFVLLWANQNSSFANAAFFRWLGKISFSVYLLHSPIIMALRASGLSGIEFVLATLAATIPFAALTFRWIEQPGLEFARMLTRRRSMPIAVEVASIAAKQAQ